MFERLNRVLSGGLLSLKGPGELERRLELAGEGFEVADDVVGDLGSWLRPVVIVVKHCERRFGGSWSAGLATGPTTILMFCSSVFILLVYPLQLMRNNSSDAAGIVIVIREFLVAALFSHLSPSLALIHKYFDQINVVFEAVVLSDE